MLIFAFIICCSKQIFEECFPSPTVFLFLSRLCKKMFLISRFCFCQQILSGFLSSFHNQFFIISRFDFCQQMSLQTSSKFCSHRPARIFASIIITFVSPDLSGACTATPALITVHCDSKFVVFCECFGSCERS